MKRRTKPHETKYGIENLPEIKTEGWNSERIWNHDLRNEWRTQELNKKCS